MFYTHVLDQIPDQVIQCLNLCRAFSPPYDMEDLLEERIDNHVPLDRVNTVSTTRKYKILPTAFAFGAERNCFLAMDVFGFGQPLQVRNHMVPFASC